jgi:hypothetical protein
VDHLDPRYRPIVYDVALSPEQIQQWATDGVPPAGTRTRAAQAGRRSVRVSSQVSRGDNLSPLAEDESQQVSRGDSLSPLESERRGDNSARSAVTNPAFRGDTGVTRTIHEPSREPSSSSPPPAHAPAAGTAATGGGSERSSLSDVLDVLAEAVRDHPSVVPSAIARRVRALEQRGWPRDAVRERLAGIESAEAPGAAALTRLDALAALAPPAPTRTRPPWCRHCDERTRLRESAHHDRVYRCPDCHPRTAIAADS